MQNRGTNLWDQILGSEIELEIDNRAYGSAASKINTMILEKSPQAEIHRYSNHLVNELLDNETSTTILSFYMSDELDHWPSIIKDRIASQISNIGMAHLVNAENEDPDHPRISQGFVIGPNQQYVSVGRIDNLNHDLSPHGIQRSLEQTTEFKNMLLNVLQSE